MPGVTTALVGMSQVEHVDENLQLVRIAPAPREEFLRIFESEDAEEESEDVE